MTKEAGIQFADPDKPQGRVAPSSLHEGRIQAVVDALVRCGARRVADLGCGPGPLFERLIREDRFDVLTGVELRLGDLETLKARVAPVETRAALRFIHGSFLDPALDLGGHDAIVMLETLEHIEPDALSQVERAFFVLRQPRTVIITTPNADYNPVLGLKPGRKRHWDHRFEWGRERFRHWANGVAGRNGCAVRFDDVGPCASGLGAPTQMAIFERRP